MYDNFYLNNIVCRIILAMMISLLGISCSEISGTENLNNNSSQRPLSLEYDSNTSSNVLGISSQLTPSTLNKGVGENFSCQFKEQTPSWLSIDNSSCEITNLSVFSGSFGPYTVVASDELTSDEFSLTFEIKTPTTA